MLTHTMPLLVWPLLPFTVWLLVPLGATAGYSLYRCWRRHAMRVHHDAIRRMHWLPGQDCRLQLASGQEVTATLQQQAVVLRWLVILHFRGPGRQLRHLVILPDMLSTARFRRLRAVLRITLQQPGD